MAAEQPWRIRVGALAFSLGLSALGHAGPVEHEEVVMRGAAICFDAESELRGVGAECPDDPEGGWGLRAGNGAIQRFSSLDERVQILKDVRVRSKPLEVTAWRDDAGELAIVHLYTLIDGRRHAPHYYCELCAIRSNAPGPCWCCQAPFEFREPPVEDEDPAAE
jgi:hypothetical protein